MRLPRPSWSAYALIMGRGCTGYTAIAGGMPGMTHSYQIHGLLAAAWGHQSSHGYGLFEAKMPSEKMRLIRRLWGAECELNAKQGRKKQGLKTATQRLVAMMQQSKVVFWMCALMGFNRLLETSHYRLTGLLLVEPM